MMWQYLKRIWSYRWTDAPEYKAHEIILSDKKYHLPQWKDYLNRHPEDPVVNKKFPWPFLNSLPQNIKLTKEDDNVLSKINADVNKDILYTKDQFQYGIKDKWESGPHIIKGDCEDIALEKRRRAIQAGYPWTNLRILILKVDTGFEPAFYHATLIVKTDRGDWCMEMGHTDIKPINAFPLNDFWYLKGMMDHTGTFRIINETRKVTT